MKIKVLLVIISLVISLSIIVIAQNNNIYEKKVEFYYNPQCSHCQEVMPLINKFEDEFSNWNFYYFDITKEKYSEVSAVPMVKVFPEKDRTITLLGSLEISKYLKCELQEMSTLECMTHNELNRGSYFID